MDSTIPLFQLPERAIKLTLKHCDIAELIFFSTLSKRAKNFVRSNKRYAVHIEIDVGTGCIVHLGNWSKVFFGETQQKYTDIQSLSPCAVRVIEQLLPAETSFTLPRFGVRDWLVHFAYFFNHPMVNVSFGDRDKWMYSVDLVKKVLEGFSIKNLSVSENACEIIKLFPNMNSLQINRTNLETQLSEAESNFIKKVLIGNMACLVISRKISIDLNTLLTMNCPEIYIFRNSITDKELNRFLKLWLRGAGPSLQEVYINFEQVRNGVHFNQSVILRGIRHEGSFEENEFESEYTIWKRDGTQATLIMSTVYFYFNVHP